LAYPVHSAELKHKTY